jgi:5-methyltetrahydropteroyltriglutamate--homocysteine methyltransferase
LSRSFGPAREQFRDAADRLSFAPDCGLSQTARWAAKQKLKNMVEGVKRVRKELGV